MQEVENFNQRKLGAMGSEGLPASEAAVFSYLDHVQSYPSVDSSCITTVAFLHKWMKHKCMFGLLGLESYHTCYDINYVSKSLVYLDNVLVLYLVGLVHQRSDVTICCFGIAGSWISLWYTLWKHVKELTQSRHADILKRGNRVHIWPETQAAC